MRVKVWLLSCSLLAAAGSMGTAMDTKEKQRELVEREDGEARILTTFIFPFFRQYQEIDLGDNLNNLKSANTATFFIVRDTIAVSAINI